MIELSRLNYTDSIITRGSIKVDLKVVLLGQNNCGKTCLVERYLHGRYGPEFPLLTIGVDFGAKRVDVYNRTITMGIWDTAGHERYDAMSRMYYRGAKAAIVCYDLTNELGFGKARFWVEELTKNEEHCKIYLCGTKVDLVEEDRNCRKVDYHSTTDYADKIRAQVFETSSKTGYNVKELFFKIAKDFVDDPKNNENGEESPNTLKLTEDGHKKSCMC